MTELFTRSEDARDERVQDDPEAGARRIAAALLTKNATVNDLGTGETAKVRLRKTDDLAAMVTEVRRSLAKTAKFTVVQAAKDKEAATGEGEIAPVKVTEAGLAAETVPEHARIRYEQFIDGLELPDPDKLKLKEMMSEPRWQNALATAKELKASRLPTYEQVVDELTTFSLEKFRDICAEMEIPRIVIESDQSFAANIAGMNKDKHYTSADGRPQKDAYVEHGADSPYRNPPKPDKVIVTITDGKPRKKQLSEVSPKLGKRRDHLTQKFAKKGMSHISLNGMAALLQQSLRQADLANDKTLIVDNWEDGNGTITFIDPSSLTESSLVACAYFNSPLRQAEFYAYNSERDYALARGRASMQVLEI